MTRCKYCLSGDVIFNGISRVGSQQYHCRDCGRYGVLYKRDEVQFRLMLRRNALIAGVNGKKRSEGARIEKQTRANA
jgi:hypothetical protein